MLDLRHDIESSTYVLVIDNSITFEKALVVFVSDVQSSRDIFSPQIN
jgi:hypothetical protein